MFVTKSVLIKNVGVLLKFSKLIYNYNVPKETAILATQSLFNYRKRYFCLAKTEEVSSNTSENILGSTNSGTILKENLSKDTPEELEIQVLHKPFSAVGLPKIEDVSDYAPAIAPSYNFAAYVNDSPLLQEFVKLGVRLHWLEKNKETAEFILKLNFEKNVKEHLRFLHDNGLEPEAFGEFISLNPLIFKEDLDNLQIRINYLKSKKFSSGMISVIITKNPKWLSFGTSVIDSRLGYFQREFKLKGYEVRNVTVRQPKLITYNPAQIKVNVFSFREEMGFNVDEMKKILLSNPRLFMRSKNHLLDRFNYLHNVMKISHELITNQSGALSSRLFRIKERHQFLESLGRAQYNPKEPCYISLQALVSGNDADFCKNVAKTSIQTFNIFQKTL